MRFTISSLAILVSLTSVLSANVFEPRQAAVNSTSSAANSTSTSTPSNSTASASSSAASAGASNSVAQCQANTPSGQYVSYSSGYANVCCLGTPSICYYRQQASLPSSEQCTIPSCADLNSGTSSLMKGFVDLNGNTANNDAASNGTSSGANVPGQAFGSSGASAFPDATDLNAAASFKLNQLSSLVLAGSAMVYLMV